MTTPAFNLSGLPAYSTLDLGRIEANNEQLLTENRAEIERLLAANTIYSCCLLYTSRCV